MARPRFKRTAAVAGPSAGSGIPRLRPQSLGDSGGCRDPRCGQRPDPASAEDDEHMTTNLLPRKKTRGIRPEAAIGPAIGEADAHVFTCPRCSRPLNEGAPRCPGCGTRLIMGVMLKRAAGILALGFVLGILAGGTVTAMTISGSLHPSSPAAIVTPSIAPGVAPVSVAPSQAPVLTAVSAPQAAVAALSGTAVVNGRIALDAATLSAALAAKDGSSVEIARALRSLAADAALGNDVAARLVPWHDAATAKTELETFYRTMTDTARLALQAPFSDTSGYRAQAAQMLKVLAGLAHVDATSRTLAASVSLELPPVALPAN